MQLKSLHNLKAELNRNKQFEGWLKGIELKSCFTEMKSLKTKVYISIGIFLALCLVFAYFLYFTFTTTRFMFFMRENGLDKVSWFQPVFFGALGLIGLLLIYFTDKSARKIRQIRTLHLLPKIFENIKPDENYYLFLSLKGKFYSGPEKKEFDTWLVLFRGKTEGQLLTLTDQSWIDLNLGSKKPSKEHKFSFMQVYNSSEQEATKFVDELYKLEKKSSAPEFPSNKIKHELFIIDPNKFRNFDVAKMAEAITSL